MQVIAPDFYAFNLILQSHRLIKKFYNAKMRAVFRQNELNIASDKTKFIEYR